LAKKTVRDKNKETSPTLNLKKQHL